MNKPDKKKQLTQRLVITDPKGLLLEEVNYALASNGYKIKVLDLAHMEQSDYYNPYKCMQERITVIDMQNEQQAQQALRVVMDGSRITAQSVISCMYIVTQYSQTLYHGRQSIKHLNLQGHQLTSIPIKDPQLQAIKRQLKSYSVDFSIMREKQPDGMSDKTSLWFKSQDQERIRTAFENVIADIARDPHAADIEKRPSSVLNAEKAAHFAKSWLVR